MAESDVVVERKNLKIILLHQKSRIFFKTNPKERRSFFGRKIASFLMGLEPTIINSSKCIHYN
jgi:recombinational DNA repair ATPase RecF